MAVIEVIYMEKILNQEYTTSNALCNAKDVVIEECNFRGDEGAKAPLHNTTNVTLLETTIDQEQALWNCSSISLDHVTVTEYANDAIWNACNVQINHSNFGAVRALRNVKDLKVLNSNLNSPQVCWKCEGVQIENTKLIAEGAFLECSSVNLNRINFAGRNAFQYTSNVQIKDSIIKTQEAFWHSKNVTITDSLLEGERLGWYTENMTLIRCHIKGSTPFAYAKGLKLVDCTMAETDNAFMESEVEATINSEVASVKNPLAGTIEAEGFGKVICEVPTQAKIITRKKI